MSALYRYNFGKSISHSDVWHDGPSHRLKKGGIEDNETDRRQVAGEEVHFKMWLPMGLRMANAPYVTASCSVYPAGETEIHARRSVGRYRCPMTRVDCWSENMIVCGIVGIVNNVPFTEVARKMVRAHHASTECEVELEDMQAILFLGWFTQDPDVIRTVMTSCQFALRRIYWNETKMTPHKLYLTPLEWGVGITELI